MRDRLSGPITFRNNPPLQITGGAAYRRVIAQGIAELYFTLAIRDLRLRERPSLSRIASYRLPAYPALSPLASPAPPGTRVNGLIPARTQMAVAHLRHHCPGNAQKLVVPWEAAAGTSRNAIAEPPCAAPPRLWEGSAISRWPWRSNPE